jgi:hypothetical protein
MAHGTSIFEVESQMQASPECENRQVTSPDTGNFDANGNLVVNYRPGDTLQGLAMAAYGDPSLAYLIARANGITAGSQLASLKQVVIPKVSVPASTGTMQSSSADSGTPAKVGVTVVQYKPGDTLESLAVQAYGDGGYWELIAKQNNVQWYDDLSKLGSITIPDFSVLKQAGDRAEAFLNQLQARGFNMLSNGTIVDPGRASGPSQGALDYANEMAMSNFDSNAASNVQTTATNSARVSAAWYLLSHPNATDRELSSEYLSEYNYVYDDGMSTLAQQAGSVYAGDRFSDFMAMESGGFANNGPDFGRADQFAAEMQGKTDALYRGNTSKLDSLFSNVSSVSDLTADDLGPQKLDIASLTNLAGIAGPSPLDTGNGLGSTTMAGAGTTANYSNGGDDQPLPGNFVPYNGSLTQNHPSVPVLTAGDLKLPGGGTSSLTSLSQINGPSRDDPSVRLPDGTLVSSLPDTNTVPAGYLTPFNAAHFPSPIALGSGSASLTVDRAGNIFNQTYDANGVAGPLMTPQFGQPANIPDLLNSTYNPQDRLTLLKFAADNIDPLTYAAPAAQLDFNLNPSAKTLARLNEVNNADTLARLAAALPLAGASAGVGSAVLLPAFGGAGSYVAVSGSSVAGDGIFQVGNYALGNQQGWNSTETLVAAGLPAIAKFASPYVSALIDGGSTTVAPSVSKSTITDNLLPDNIVGNGLIDHPVAPYNVTKPVYLPGYTETDILIMAKGTRPDPATYLDPVYISNHLQTFDETGAGFLFTDADIENPKYPSFNPTKFVMAGRTLTESLLNSKRQVILLC